MAPLVPEYISEEFNFVVAFVIGIGFGFILESAGFSSTRKLAGLFYGYDFTVLKVFFTAGITAMLGVLLLGHFELLDLSVIYINPTFLWSALIGGAIMGAGFIIGGFCPGTSVCAAAIGKVDGIAFVLGGLIGVFVFAEAYPWFEGIYLAQDLGAVRIYDALGMSAGTFAVALTAIALAAFAFTTRIQDRVNHIRRVLDLRVVGRTLLIGMTPFLLASFLFVVPDTETQLRDRAADPAFRASYDHATVQPDKLVWELLYKTDKVLLIDTRPAEAYRQSHIPLAINVPLDSLFRPEWRRLLETRRAHRVFYGADDDEALRALIIAEHWMEGEHYVLAGGKAAFDRQIMDIQVPVLAIPTADHGSMRFAVKAAQRLREIEVQRLAAPAGAPKAKRKVKGGCS
ncbi:MAG: hypothetical protein OHK0039_15040 [Bacteroidia bacterium]